MTTELRIQRRPEGAKEQIEPSVLSKETPGQTARRLRGELEEQTTAMATSLWAVAQSGMDDEKSVYDTEMAQMRQSNRDSTTECNTAMKANANSGVQQMDVHMADHGVSITVMRRAYDGVEEKRNEQLNALNVANAQRLTNLEQRLDAQFSTVKQRQLTAEMRHSQRMDVLRFSHIRMASDARNSYAFDLEAQREHTKDTQQTQQNWRNAANQEHHQKIDGEGLRHVQKMRDLKTSSDDKTAKHNENHNRMAMHFFSIESKLKQSEERCALYERTLAENRKAIQDAESRRYLLIAQTEAITIIKADFWECCAI